jgi:hypothetical protein
MPELDLDVKSLSIKERKTILKLIMNSPELKAKNIEDAVKSAVESYRKGYYIGSMSSKAYDKYQKANDKKK